MTCCSSGYQAARAYSLIRPPRTGFRRIRSRSARGCPKTAAITPDHQQTHRRTQAKSRGGKPAPSWPRSRPARVAVTSPAGARGAAFLKCLGCSIPFFRALAGKLYDDVCAVAWQLFCELRPLPQSRALQLKQAEKLTAAIAESQGRIPLQFLENERNVLDRACGPGFCAGVPYPRGRSD